MDPIDWKTVGGYGTVPGLPSTAGFVNNPTTSSPSPESSIWTRSAINYSTIKPILGYSLTSKTSTAPPSSVTSTGPSKLSAFAQMVHGSNPVLYHVTNDQLLSTSFDDICPSGNCISDCSNISRVFQAVPDGINTDPQHYGRLDSKNKSEVTLFGTCSNLDYTTSLGKTGSFAAYFPADDSRELSTIASRITTCFATTCEQTRNPALCATACSASNLLSSATAFDYNRGLPDCVVRLCDSTCSLPYVDPDVLGIGVRLYFILH